ncbi:phosphoglycolate phosphatase [Clostridium sp. TW13]|uniref:Phosphoglycolate phosphatase n=2 Tax=Inconstantimicrobium mannanitabidum TaxID=1604901 RepID=A0ACB5RGL1_9CLOT|nr:phosphoglycolate phosphatase [Clostridium sp. TW13]
MAYEYILFDLDGTLTDSGVGIINSVEYALQKCGIEVKDKNELYKFVGPPLTDSFEMYYDFSKEEANTAIKYYREYFREKGMFENLVYDGIEKLLKELKVNNKKLIVATSKAEVFAKQILEHFNIAEYFSYIAGSNLDGTRVKKAEVIKYALESCNIEDLSKTIMVGDREHDIIGAKEVGLKCIGVLYGYGDRSEFEKAGADFIVETVSDVEQVLLG